MPVAALAHGAQRGVVADRYAARETRRRPASKGERQAMDNLIESSRAPRPRLEEVVVEAFREDASPAQNRLAAEAPGLERQHDAPSRNRQVRQAARISTMDPVRNRATGRAGAVHAPRAYRNDGAIAPSLNASTAENPVGSNSVARRDCMALIPSRNQATPAPQLHQM